VRTGDYSFRGVLRGLRSVREGWGTFKYSDSSREIIHSPRRLQCSDYDRWRRNKIVCERIVKIPLGKVSLEAVSPLRFRLSDLRRLTWSSNTSWTLSNSFSYLCKNDVSRHSDWLGGPDAGMRAAVPGHVALDAEGALRSMGSWGKLAYRAVNSSKVSSSCPG
jgi:hypothetical protein